jgi:hypothetical protein
MSTCKTPGAVYETNVAPEYLSLTILFPRPVLAMPCRDQQVLVRKVHRAVLPVIEKLYHDAWERCFRGQMIDGQRMPHYHEDL